MVVVNDGLTSKICICVNINGSIPRYTYKTVYQDTYNLVIFRPDLIVVIVLFSFSESVVRQFFFSNTLCLFLDSSKLKT